MQAVIVKMALSPIGRNAYFCCSRYDILSLYDIAFIIKHFVRTSYVQRVQSLNVIHCLLELIYVRHGYSSLSLLTCIELVYAISHVSRAFFLIFLCTLFTSFNNKKIIGGILAQRQFTAVQSEYLQKFVSTAHKNTTLTCLRNAQYFFRRACL